MSKMTNAEFGRRVNCDHSMASLIKSGKRKPGGELLVAIILEFKLDPVKAMEAYEQGAEQFGAFVTATVYQDENESVEAQS